MFELTPDIEEQFVVDGFCLLNEFLYGSWLPEAVDDGAAVQRDIRSVFTVSDERSACDVDVAKSAAALLYGAHHEGREDAAVQDGEDDVAAAGEPTGREPSRASRSQKGRGQKARHSQEEAPDSLSGRQPGEQDGSNLQGAHSAEAADALAGDVSLPGRRRKRRGSRPSMPSWDEIVFGKKD